MTAVWADLAAAIGVAPALRGARCRGRSHLFDCGEPHEPAELVAQRHAQALSLCRACPSLGPCSEWLDSLPRSNKPLGVIAGQVHGPKIGRPKRTA